ncbi:hypothetical protein HMPREF3107_08600 [Neisseria sp. HMSC31F04]|uniref:DUF4112 domain-containing protein n=1 Tax=Neisseria sp. HMSC31F04 TaxID=1581075 RepID=UPI0008A5375F|nr:DUF4112 domain-containing protein [Neisseria sp. HMSC31F04]OFT00061.1 hypothetical protein HMPREF3107_08600 [Neisseria sp. HMSC31F04]
MNNTPAPFDRQEIIRRERHLAKYANTMDSLFCIPFTKQGIGIDALLSLIPFVGDIAGLLLTLKAFRMGRELGVPEEKMRPAVYLALADMLLGMIPVVGTLIDIFLQPTFRTMKIVNEHVRSEYGIDTSLHLERPFMHAGLEKKQAQSAFWRKPAAAWLYLQLPDFFGLVMLVLMT